MWFGPEKKLILLYIDRQNNWSVIVAIPLHNKWSYCSPDYSRRLVLFSFQLVHRRVCFASMYQVVIRDPGLFLFLIVLLYIKQRYVINRNLLEKSYTNKPNFQHLQDKCLDAGVILGFLPPYFPNFNPIEGVFSIIEDQMEKKENNNMLANEYEDYLGYLNAAVEANSEVEYVRVIIFYMLEQVLRKTYRNEKEELEINSDMNNTILCHTC